MHVFKLAYSVIQVGLSVAIFEEIIVFQLCFAFYAFASTFEQRVNTSNELFGSCLYQFLVLTQVMN